MMNSSPFFPGKILFGALLFKKICNCFGSSLIDSYIFKKDSFECILCMQIQFTIILLNFIVFMLLTLRTHDHAARPAPSTSS